MVMRAVLPVWLHERLPFCNPPLASMVTKVLTNCLDGTAAAAAATPSAARQSS
jgi:hypothetical protein